VVSQSFVAFGDILELHKKFLELSGGINRIFELEEVLHAAQRGKFLVGFNWKFLCVFSTIAVALVPLQDVTSLIIWHVSCLV
jgi:hypothetical protein